MGLATFFDAACFELHHVHNYEQFFPPDQYRVTTAFTVNRPSYKPLFPNEMHWDARTPPAVIDIDLWERRTDPSATDPIIHIHFVIIDCVPTINFLGTTHWWFGNSLQITLAQGAAHSVRWVHIQLGDDEAGSVGLYLFPFVE
jgi:hypothetical protein